MTTKTSTGRYRLLKRYPDVRDGKGRSPHWSGWPITYVHEPARNRVWLIVYAPDRDPWVESASDAMLPEPIADNLWQIDRWYFRQNTETILAMVKEFADHD